MYIFWLVAAISIIIGLGIFSVYNLSLVLWLSLAISCIFFAFAIVSFVKMVIPHKKINQKAYNADGISVAGFTLVSIWFLRLAVGLFAGSKELNFFETLFDSFVHALQSFSMDEDYTLYIENGREMMGYLLKNPDSFWVDFVSACASVLNVVAPIAGGAFLFVILMNLSAKIRLWFANISHSEKYYFSNLNERSLALAKAIREMDKNILTRAKIVFADVYDLDEGGIDTDIITEAKVYGAVCVKENIHIIPKRSGCKIFLIQEDEVKNLQELSSLTDEYNYESLKNAEIYLFVDNGTYNQIENNVYEKLRNSYKFKEEELPTIVPVQSYRNLITNLLVKIPLYEPLVNKEGEKVKRTVEIDGESIEVTTEEKELNVTILGTGYIGTEMFLSTYWFGQMLDTKLNINVISLNDEEKFRGRIDTVNPEILLTAQKGHKILEYREGEFSPPYFTYKHYNCEFGSSEFINLIKDKDKGILKTDYFLVALGSDSENVACANELLKYIGQYHIEEYGSSGRPAPRTIIAYVVYDSEFANMLNVRKSYSSLNDGKIDIYMQAVGTLDEVYSAENVFMSEYEPLAEHAGMAYLSTQNKETREKAHKDRMNDDYKHWANIARSMHLMYRVYSLGFINHTVFDYGDAENPEYKNQNKSSFESYRSYILGNIGSEEKRDIVTFKNNMHRMSWLEHRRWCAFTRIKGFRNTNGYNFYARPDKKGSYKQMDMKLHPCLRECDMNGVQSGIDGDGKIIKENGLFTMKDTKGLDYLDCLSFELYKKNLNGYDFKMYDYPTDDCKL